MGKISLIIHREYTTRVRKKSFIIMAVLGPILFAALMLLPSLLMMFESKEVKNVVILEYDRYNQPKTDSLLVFKGIIPDTDDMHFTSLPGVSIETIQESFDELGYYAALWIPENITYNNVAKLFSTKQPSLDVKNHIEGAIEKYLYDSKLRTFNISVETINKAKTDISVQPVKWTATGEVASSTGMSMAIGYASGLLIYMLIFIFGAQVMRGIIEEKTSRIVEVIVTSVKPVQLMMGKILGIALVGLTQFAIWLILTTAIYSGVTSYIQAQQMPDTQEITKSLFESELGVDTDQSPTPQATAEIAGILDKLEGQDFIEILVFFLLYFIGGYLLYAALFAAVGSAVDSETDVQQFMMPITIPLILGIMTMMAVINNPDGPIAFWFSVIPLTSPIVMMARIPFGVELWEKLLSVGILYGSFILATFMAAKIYRTGILMYGKKVNYRELIKWLRYKN